MNFLNGIKKIFNTAAAAEAASTPTIAPVKNPAKDTQKPERGTRSEWEAGELWQAEMGVAKSPMDYVRTPPLKFVKR